MQSELILAEPLMMTIRGLLSCWLGSSEDRFLVLGIVELCAS